MNEEKKIETAKEREARLSKPAAARGLLAGQDQEGPKKTAAPGETTVAAVFRTIKRLEKSISDIQQPQIGISIYRKIERMEKSIGGIHEAQIAISNALREIWQVLIMGAEWDKEKLAAFNDSIIEAADKCQNNENQAEVEKKWKKE